MRALPAVICSELDPRRACDREAYESVAAVSPDI